MSFHFPYTQIKQKREQKRTSKYHDCLYTNRDNTNNFVEQNTTTPNVM